MDIVFNTFFPGSSLSRDQARGFHRRQALDGSPKWITKADLDYETFTETKLSKATNTFGNLKAPGPDGFQPKVLKEFIKGKSIQRLLALYMASYALGYVPRPWRTSKAISIPKLDKDYNQVKAFRPLSLCPFFF